MKSNQHSGFKYLFGPVPSRRLGVSLGVDLLPPKTCSLNCVYCEAGPTTRLTLKRKEYSPKSDILEELRAFLEPRPELDYITFSGSGEPLLHSGIGEIIHFLKTKFAAYKVAVLTNGTLCGDAAVRGEIAQADLVIASLDAATVASFERVNRPHPALAVEDMIAGLAAFKRGFAGRFWAEVFIVPGINDQPETLRKIKTALDLIGPDKTQINSLDRPGAEQWVEPLAPEARASIMAYLSGAEAIRAVDGSFALRGVVGDESDRILNLVKRRPCTRQDMVRTLGLKPEKVTSLLALLQAEGRIRSQPMARGVFYLPVGRE